MSAPRRTEYIVIHADGLDSLTHRVQEAITKDGWEPVAGFAVVHHAGVEINGNYQHVYDEFYQPMMRTVLL